jgi:L-alanine-DL-glutamate epimerase-like enolase superfamily enzyme
MAELQRKTHTYGRSGPIFYGLSGIDIALWDIAGQIAGKPIAKLLADDAATTIPSYASLLRYDDAELAARNAVDAVERGYTRVKLHEIGVAEVKAAREAIGPSIDLTLDTNCRWAPAQALTNARGMEPFNLTFIEEPVWPPEDYDRLREVSRGTRIAIAAGENHTTLFDFERLIDVGGVRYIQPSVTKVGGITEMLRIVTMAHARGVAVAPHSPYFGPGLIAAAHLCASVAREAALEQFYCQMDARPFDGGVGAMNGTIRVPDGPGLCVMPDMEAIARYRVA